MTIPFCKKCGCVADEDFEYCNGCMEEVKNMDCAVPCNGVCRSCHQPVVWVTMVPSMKSTPINPELEEGGNVEIRPNKAGKLFAKVTGPDAEQKKHTSHFVNCPHADQWRNRQTSMDL